MIFRVLMIGMLLGTAVAQAQEPLRIPPVTPAPGSPGTATPQPYGQPGVPTPNRRHDTAPLLPPPVGQPLPGGVPRREADKPIPQLDQQLRRNSQELDEPQRSQP